MNETDIVDLNQWLSVAEAREYLAKRQIKLSATYLYALANRYTPRPEGAPWEGQKGLKSRLIKSMPCLFRADVEAFAEWKKAKAKARSK